MQDTRNYTTPGRLAFNKAFLNAVFSISLVLSVVLLAAAYRAEERYISLRYLLASVVLYALLLYCSIVYEDLKLRIRDAYFDSPLGVFFTGSLYRSKEWQLLPGHKKGAHASSTKLTRNPYPDGVAIGANGVIKTWNESAWFAHLVTVNGRLSVTRICPAEYGWQAFIREKLS